MGSHTVYSVASYVVSYVAILCDAKLMIHGFVNMMIFKVNYSTISCSKCSTLSTL